MDLKRLETYINMIDNLHRNKRRGEYAPHKPVLLITLIDAIARGIITSNLVRITPELVALFRSCFRALVKADSWNAQIVRPFRHLIHDGFWELVKDDKSLSVEQLGDPSSISGLIKIVDGGKFDTDLWELLQDGRVRDILKNHILKTYFGIEEGDLAGRILTDSTDYEQRKGVEVATEEETPIPLTSQDVVVGRESEPPDTETPEEKEDTHLRMQYLLVKIGLMDGHEVWVAKNDRNKEYNGDKLADICLNELPHFADPNVLRIAESIDVIWFRRNTARPLSFFEIEHTTSVYSGLLRLNDVRIDYPIPKAYIVAQETRRSLFESQINRRTFSMSELDEVCRFMNYETVEQWYKNLESIQKIKEGF